MTMARYTCTRQDCTIEVTGKCLELHEPAQCPNSILATAAPTAVKPSAIGSTLARKFLPGMELGLKDALSVTLRGYAHLIAILGATDAGKTCMLNALYLLASHASLAPSFRFAGSLTLAGFEARTRRLRNWENGRLPEQLAEHTTHADPRNPGLLHLSLLDDRHGSRRVELLLTDLPGEWTTGLIKHAQTCERFEFLQRADGLVIAVDGVRLRDVSQKHLELLNLEHLVDRLADAVDLDRRVPIFFVACKADSFGLKLPPELQRVIAYAQSKGFVAQAAIVASFSRNPDEVENGHGIQALVESILDHRSPKSELPAIKPEPSRSFGRSLGTS